MTKMQWWWWGIGELLRDLMFAPFRKCAECGKRGAEDWAQIPGHQRTYFCANCWDNGRPKREFMR